MELQREPGGERVAFRGRLRDVTFLDPLNPALLSELAEERGFVDEIPAE